MAALTSFPTLFEFTSNARANSMSFREYCVISGRIPMLCSGYFLYNSTPWTRAEATFPTPTKATLIAMVATTDSLFKKLRRFTTLTASLNGA